MQVTGNKRITTQHLQERSATGSWQPVLSDKIIKQSLCPCLFPQADLFWILTQHHLYIIFCKDLSCFRRKWDTSWNDTEKLPHEFSMLLTRVPSLFLIFSNSATECWKVSNIWIATQNTPRQGATHVVRHYCQATVHYPIPSSPSTYNRVLSLKIPIYLGPQNRISSVPTKMYFKTREDLDQIFHYPPPDS